MLKLYNVPRCLIVLSRYYKQVYLHFIFVVLYSFSLLRHYNFTSLVHILTFSRKHKTLYRLTSCLNCCCDMYHRCNKGCCCCCCWFNAVWDRTHDLPLWSSTLYHWANNYSLVGSQLWLTIRKLTAISDW